MTTPSHQLPQHAPVNRSGIARDFARQVLGKRDARRVERILETAAAQVRTLVDRRLAEAKDEADAIVAAARAEAAAILARLPDFSAIEAAPAARGKSAYQAMRGVADRHGLPLAVVVGRARHERAQAARAEAVRAVAAACPAMADADIAALFSGISARTVRRLRLGGAL